MGEVYRARDTRLDRTVAVKVLPGHLSDDVEARQRFEREAKSISSLNHTNVCTLQDIGKHDGIDFQVMEFLEGKTLADRLTRGPLPTAAGGPVMVLADAPNPRGGPGTKATSWSTSPTTAIPCGKSAP
jgi:serine/threonine protein kinase